MKSILSFALAIGLIIASCAGSSEMQSVELPTLPPDIEIYTDVDQMPEMIGGVMAIGEFLRYPNAARRDRAQGRTMVKFVVDPDGRTNNLEVTRSSGRADLDKAALEAMAQVRFEPGMENGEAVHVEMQQPVIFRLN